MKVAVLSGKGGTGKTFVSTNLAEVMDHSVYLDCDVEEPNGHIFFKPENIRSSDVAVKVPVVNQSLCKGCRECVDFCRYNALAAIGYNIKVFEDVCHSCGGCTMVCPTNAISEEDKVIGRIDLGESSGTKVISGFLNVGVASGVPVIKEVLSEIHKNDYSYIVDCPPGSACVVMESIKDADYCVLVAEPTIFGVHNLEMVYELVRRFKKPYGVILNKSIGNYNPSESFCSEWHIPVLAKIAYDKVLAKRNSEGHLIVRESEDYKKVFETIAGLITKEVKGETIISP